MYIQYKITQGQKLRLVQQVFSSNLVFFLFPLSVNSSQNRYITLQNHPEFHLKAEDDITVGKHVQYSVYLHNNGNEKPNSKETQSNLRNMHIVTRNYKCP